MISPVPMATETCIYEVRPCAHDDQNMVYECDSSEASFWGLYERPALPDDHGERLAVWVADFAREDDSTAFAELLLGQLPKWSLLSEGLPQEPGEYLCRALVDHRGQGRHYRHLCLIFAEGVFWIRGSRTPLGLVTHYMRIPA